MSEYKAEKAEVRCGCPRGLGYRFHRHPCGRAGEIENVTTGEVTLRGVTYPPEQQAPR